MITQSVGVPRTAKWRGPTSRSRKRIVQRQRMRDAGLIELRRHDPDVVGQRARDLLDDLQAGGMDAVVIGAENSHPSKCLLVRFEAGFRLRAPSYPAIAAEANRPISSCLLHPDAPGAHEFGAAVDSHVQIRRCLLWRLDRHAAAGSQASAVLTAAWSAATASGTVRASPASTLRRFRLRGRRRRRDRLWRRNLRSYRHRPHRRPAAPDIASARSPAPCRNPRH